MTEIKGDRFNEGKLRLDLILPEWVEQIAHAYGSVDALRTRSISKSLTSMMQSKPEHLSSWIPAAIASIVFELKVKHEMHLDEIVTDLTEVMVLGEEKYSAWNWAGGMMYGTMMGCANRHWYKSHILDIKTDEESGRNHLSHCLVNVLFISFYQGSGIEGLNDLLGNKE